MDQPAPDVMRRFAAALRQRGGRVTPQQLLILLTLDGVDHLPVDALLTRLREQSSLIVDSTIYRALERLVDLGLIFKVDLGAGYQYGLVRDAPHHHLICERCRVVFEAPDDLIQPLRAALEERWGFLARIDHLALFGVCGGCQQS